MGLSVARRPLPRKLRQHLVYGRVAFTSVRVVHTGQVTTGPGKPYTSAVIDVSYTTDGRARSQRVRLIRPDRYGWRIVSFGGK